MLNVPESAAHDLRAPWNRNTDFDYCDDCESRYPVEKMTTLPSGNVVCPKCAPKCGFMFSPDHGPCESTNLVDGYDHCARCMVIDLNDYLLDRLKANAPEDDAEFFQNLRREIAEMERLRDGGAQ